MKTRILGKDVEINPRKLEYEELLDYLVEIEMNFRFNFFIYELQIIF
jgi:hypothetical protein